MNQKILEYSKKYLKKNPAEIRPGDWIKVSQKFQDGKKTRVQHIEGAVLAVKHGQGINSSVTLRKIGAAGIGIEFTFPLHSPSIIKIERLKTSQARRAKLYYLRNIKSSKITLKREKTDKKIWEEPLSEAELEKIHHEKELAAQTKAEAKQKAKAELEEKFKKAQAARNA